VADRRCAALGDRGVPRALPAVRGQSQGPRGLAVRRPRSGLRATVELGPHAVAPAARDQRQDDLPRHHVEVLMRAPTIIVAVAVLGAGAPARGEPLPSGSLGIMFGAGGGTGKYARSLGLGYHQFGAQAAWQPMTTERRIGYSLKWSFAFGTMYNA